MSPNGDSNLQLARQIAAVALYCIMSGGGSTREDTGIPTMFSAFHAACVEGNQADQISLCNGQVDCFNNGGQWNEEDPNGMYGQMDMVNSCHAQPLILTVVGGGPVLKEGQPDRAANIGGTLP